MASALQCRAATANKGLTIEQVQKEMMMRMKRL